MKRMRKKRMDRATNGGIPSRRYYNGRQELLLPGRTDLCFSGYSNASESFYTLNTNPSGTVNVKNYSRRK